jgi:hypothetical protein
MADQEQVDREAKEEARELEQQPGGLVAVTFHEMYSPYNAGETAGVDRDLAARLVKAGKAHYFDAALKHEDGRPAFDGDQPVDLAVAPNHPMRSASQSAEQQVRPGRGDANLSTLDGSSGQDMSGTSEKPSEVNKAADAKLASNDKSGKR